MVIKGAIYNTYTPIAKYIAITFSASVMSAKINPVISIGGISNIIAPNLLYFGIDITIKEIV